MKFSDLTWSFTLDSTKLKNLKGWLESRLDLGLILILGSVSIFLFYFYYQNGLGLAYNDARSHLDIGRRVVEGLKPGLAQLGSVWLPLPHLLMVPTIWNDIWWHTGLAGALPSMISFVATAVLIFRLLHKHFGVGLVGSLTAVLVFCLNLNILYLQSTAMTELLLLFTMTAGVYELIVWHQDDNILPLIKSAFWIMLSTLIRYDGWFLLIFATGFIALHGLIKRGYKYTEGILVLFFTLAGVGILFWFIWNQLIFKDALYFIFGPFSARAQQQQLEKAGILLTKGNLLYSLKVYLYAFIYNTGAFTALLGILGLVIFLFDQKIRGAIRIASLVLLSPFFFNIVALYFGHSVLFVQGISGNTWFNVRYGIMLLPTVAIFTGYLVDRASYLRWPLLAVFLFITIFAFTSQDTVTLDDARFGSSGKNVTEVSNWIHKYAGDKKDLILISAASHDAIIFSSGLPMKRYIHEGTGSYWLAATSTPDRWARWIIMRTHDDNDMTYRLIKKSPGLGRYKLMVSFPFADIYELKSQYLKQLTDPKTLKPGK